MAWCDLGTFLFGWFVGNVYHYPYPSTLDPRQRKEFNHQPQTNKQTHIQTNKQTKRGPFFLFYDEFFFFGFFLFWKISNPPIPSSLSSLKLSSCKPC